MAQDRQNAGARGNLASAEDSVIPMQKTSMTTYLAIGVGVLAIGGVVAISAGGGDSDAEKKAAEIKAQAAKKDTSKMTAKEHREHMKMTAAAFQKAEDAAAERKAEQDRKQAAAEAEAQAKVAAAAPAPGGAAPPPAAKPKTNQKAAKKQLDSLDSIGSDIASALK